MVPARRRSRAHRESSVGVAEEPLPRESGRKGADVAWPLTSPDLTPLDFFLWGHVKNEVAKRMPTSIEDPKCAVEGVIRAIPRETRIRVAEEERLRAERCRAKHGVTMKSPERLLSGRKEVGVIGKTYSMNVATIWCLFYFAMSTGSKVVWK